MAGWVDECSWSNGRPLVDNLNPRQGVFANAAAPFMNWSHLLLPRAIPDRYSYWTSLAESHQRDYQSGMERTHALLRDSSIRFVYVHLDVPHPPGIYDRHAHRFATDGSYLDNLALADVALGQMLDTLEKTPAWPRTTLIVCGDHSWRVALWREHTATWTAEDKAASAGRFDRRPVLAIHSFDQHAPSTDTRQISLLAVHDVIAGILRGSNAQP